MSSNIESKSSNIVGKRIGNEAIFDSSNETKSKVQRLDLDKFTDNNQQKHSKLSQSVKSKEKLVQRIDNILDFQLKTKQRIISFKRLKEKERRSSEKQQRSPKDPSKIQDIPAFLEKTRKRLEAHSQTSKREKIAEQQKLKAKLGRLKEIQEKALEEIRKMPKKGFEPKEDFKLGRSLESEKELEDPFGEIDFRESVQNIQKIVKVEEQTSENREDKADRPINKHDILEKKVGKGKGKENKPKSTNSELKKPKPLSGVQKTPQTRPKVPTQYINNTKYLILEREIRQKEQEILDFEKKMRLKSEGVAPGPEDQVEFLGEIEKFQQDQNNFFRQIHEKITRDFPGDSSQSLGAFAQENRFEDIERSEKIADFLQSGKVAGTEASKTPASPFDHLEIVNEIIEKNEKKKRLENEKKSDEIDLKMLSLDDFEKDIYMFKNLYSQGVEALQVSKKPAESEIPNLELQTKLFDDNFLMKPWKYDRYTAPDFKI